MLLHCSSSQRPQGMSPPKATRSPTSNPLTFAPTAVIWPEASWPMIAGGVSRGLPCSNMRKSEPHIAQAPTRTRILASSISGRATSCTSKWRRAVSTAAFMGFLNWVWSEYNAKVAKRIAKHLTE